MIEPTSWRPRFVMAGINLLPLLLLIVPNISSTSDFGHKILVGAFVCLSLVILLFAVLLPLRLALVIGFEQEKQVSVAGLVRWALTLLEFNVLPSTTSILGTSKQFGFFSNKEGINYYVVLFLMALIATIAVLGSFFSMYGFIVKTRDGERKGAQDP